MYYHVYILSFLNGMHYIGSTSELCKRIRIHEAKLKRNRHINKKLQETYNQFPEFTITVYPQESLEKARKNEKELILIYKEQGIALNIKSNSCGGDVIKNHPNKSKIIEKRTATRIRNNKSLTPEERLLKNKWSLKGKLNPMYGKTHTTETRLKIINKLKGRVLTKNPPPITEEHRAKLSAYAKTRTGSKNSFYGKKHTEETKKKLADMFRGRVIEKTCKKVIIDGVTYSSLSGASRALNIPAPTVHFRINSDNPKFCNYRYL